MGNRHLLIDGRHDKFPAWITPGDRVRREREPRHVNKVSNDEQSATVARGARALAGKTAIVTGSTSGIGLGIATSFARAGADIVINGFGDAADIERTRAMLQDHRVKCVYSKADMSKPEEILGMIELARESFGKVDILVNNAGIQHVAPIEEFPSIKWDAIIAINLSATFHASRAVFAEMKARKWGRIINIASVHGLIASPFKSAYVAAKHGVVGLTKVLALEGAEFGITANAICPGYVWTPLVEKQIDDQALVHKIPKSQVVSEILLKNQPTKKFAQIGEIAALATFLCGEDAQSLTGQALPVDGGWTAH
jgi:3-hydroxybutyrate dehydrogenase